MVLAVQCTDWWGYVGSCPGPLLCINTWGCFLGSLSDFWGHKKIFWDVQDFSYRVCQTDLAGINISDFKNQGSSLVFSSPGPIVKWALYVCGHWCQTAVLFLFWHFYFFNWSHWGNFNQFSTKHHLF